MVWVHVALATLSWLAVLWALAAAGSLQPRGTRELVGEPAPPSPRELEAVGHH
jgi:hypothetical protein